MAYPRSDLSGFYEGLVRDRRSASPLLRQPMLPSCARFCLASSRPASVKMSRSNVIGTDPCVLQRRFTISPALAQMLVVLSERVGARVSSQGIRWPGLTIISGHRPQGLQDRLNPSASNSFHTRCPALAVDLRFGDAPATTTPRLIWEMIGEQWMQLGGRWGGTFEPQPGSIWFPERDLNHFDLPLPAMLSS